LYLYLLELNKTLNFKVKHFFVCVWQLEGYRFYFIQLFEFYFWRHLNVKKNYNKNKGKTKNVSETYLRDWIGRCFCLCLSFYFCFLRCFCFCFCFCFYFFWCFCWAQKFSVNWLFSHSKLLRFVTFVLRLMFTDYEMKARLLNHWFGLDICCRIVLFCYAEVLNNYEMKARLLNYRYGLDIYYWIVLFWSAEMLNNYEMKARLLNYRFGLDIYYWIVLFWSAEMVDNNYVLPELCHIFNKGLFYKLSFSVNLN
jgi:hypothetical protein